ncbi:MAG: alpha-ribazole phosphatase [Bacteroidetes bacterium]|nr:alpha-ribazole phosphatase [Bacteroidota bacterium]
MEIYLIRHTTPAVEKGICYGQTDLDVTESFAAEADSIRPWLPNRMGAVYSSPLQRCHKLAETLFPDHTPTLYNDLMELDCGSWEMQPWNEIPRTEMQPWLEDFVNVVVPEGESYALMHERVISRFNEISQQASPAVIVAHGGVLRSILAHITGTPIKESFDLFTCHYGCVIKLTQEENGFRHEFLYNISLAGKEWHRPTA